MGYDVSAHPVDVELIQNRILPYVRGEGDIDDLVATAVRLAQVRFRANAWGLGLLNLSHTESAARRAKAPKPKAVKTAKTAKKPAAKPKWLVPDAFDANLRLGAAVLHHLAAGHRFGRHRPVPRGEAEAGGRHRRGHAPRTEPRTRGRGGAERRG